MSVSEWSLPIERGGIKTTVGEYSISAVGPRSPGTRTLEGGPTSRAQDGDGDSVQQYVRDCQRALTSP